MKRLGFLALFFLFLGVKNIYLINYIFRIPNKLIKNDIHVIYDNRDGLKKVVGIHDFLILGKFIKLEKYVTHQIFCFIHLNMTRCTGEDDDLSTLFFVPKFVNI